MSDTINALQMLNQPHGGGQLPAPAVINPLGIVSGAMQTAGQVYDLRAKQGQQLWGQALQQATDANGNVDFPKAQSIAAGMGPAAAMAAGQNLQNISNIRSQQLQQVSGLYNLIGSASASLMRDPSDGNIENIRGALTSAGAPPSALAELDRIKSIQDPAGRVTEAFNHNLAAMDAQTRLATGGFPQMQGQNIGNQIVPMGGVPASPYSRGGLVTGGGAVGTTMRPGEGGTVDAVVQGPNGPIHVQIPYQQAFPGQVSPAGGAATPAGVPQPGTIPPNPNVPEGTPPGRVVPIPANPALRNPNAPTPPATTTTPTPASATGAPVAATPPAAVPPTAAPAAAPATAAEAFQQARATGRPVPLPGATGMVANPDGSTTSVPVRAAPAAAAPVPPSAAAPAPAPAPTGSPIMQTPAGPAVVTSLPAGQPEAIQADVTAYKNAQQAMPDQQRNLVAGESALQALQLAQSGPGTSNVNRMKSFLLAQGIDLGAIDPASTVAYEIARKNLLRFAQSSATRSGTDLGLATQLQSNANVDAMLPQANEHILKQDIGLARQRIAQTLTAPAGGVGQSEFGTGMGQHVQNFTAQTDPVAFDWDLLTPAERQAHLDQISKTQGGMDKWRRSMRIARDSGVLQLPAAPQQAAPTPPPAQQPNALAAAPAPPG